MRNSYIGKETLLEHSVFWEFRQYNPDEVFLRDRMEGLFQSGIIRQWEDVLNKIKQNGTLSAWDYFEPIKIGMKSNIQAVFAVYGFCICVSIFVMMSETFRLLMAGFIRLVRLVLKHIIQLLFYLYVKNTNILERLSRIINARK